MRTRSAPRVDSIAIGVERKLDRAYRLLLLVIVASLAAPYGVLGPGYFREDWISLANAQAGGAWSAAGELVAKTRPGAALVYALFFGPLGGHVVLSWLLLMVLHAISVVLLFEVARREIGRHRAAALAALWALLPMHASLTHWISAAHIALALILALCGILAIGRAVRGEGGRWAPAPLIIGSGLCYESLLPVVLVVAFFFGLRTRRWRLLVPAATSTTLVLGWSFAVGYLVTEKAPSVWASPAHALSANIGWGLFGFSAPWTVLQAVLLAWVAWSINGILLPGFRPKTGCPERLVCAGAALIVVGVAPFMPFGADVDFVGLGDRGNVVSSIGVACLLLGLGERLLGLLSPIRIRQGAAAAMVVGAVAFILPLRLDQDREWSAIWDWQRAVLEAASAVHDGQGSIVTLGHRSVGNPAVEGLNTELDSTAALRFWTGDHDALVDYERDVRRHVDVNVEAERPGRLRHSR